MIYGVLPLQLPGINATVASVLDDRRLWVATIRYDTMR